MNHQRRFMLPQCYQHLEVCVCAVIESARMLVRVRMRAECVSVCGEGEKEAWVQVHVCE